MTKTDSLSILSGRVLLSLIFVMSGVGKLFDWEKTAGYMTANGMPMAQFFLFGAVILLLGGGLSVLFGYRAKRGALMLIIFLIPATLIFHQFWAVADAGAQKMQMIAFLKNLGLLGGLVLIMVHGSGRFSIDSGRR